MVTCPIELNKTLCACAWSFCVSSSPLPFSFSVFCQASLVTVSNPNLDATDKAIELNTKGKLATFAAGAVGGGLSDAVFVGDVEEMGTFGDLLGGPTELNRGEGETDYDPTRELINRVKFGTESSLFTASIGAVFFWWQAANKKQLKIRMHTCFITINFKRF